MPIEIRAPEEDELEMLFRADGRAFGFNATPEEIQDRRPMLELPRFRVAFDGREMVGTSGAYTFDLTLPGGGTVPASGVTWVSTQVTHRRQGVMSQMLDALHRDAVDRGEPVAILTASESAIYERLGYGVGSHNRAVTLSKAQARLRPEAPAKGRVRYADPGDALRAHAVRTYDRYRRACAGEVSRNDAWWDMIFKIRAKEMDGLSAAFWLVHDDGYLAYRIEQKWNDGHPAHRVDISELVTVTDEARAALLRMLFDLDLAGEYSSRFLALDDPLPYWLEHPRALKTTLVNDWLWVKPLDVATLLRTRSYGVDDRLVVDVSGVRYAIAAEGGIADVRRVRTRPDITTNDAGLGALLMGGVRASVLARGGRLQATDVKALRRADALFMGDRLAHSQTGF